MGLLGLLPFSVAGSGAQLADPTTPVRDVVRTVWVMGTSLEVRVGTVRGASDAAALAEAAIRSVERAEATLSSWRAGSALSRASRLPPGERWSPEPALEALLDEVESWRIRTGRAFEPNLGALVDAWGLRDGGRLPTDSALTAAVEATRIGVLRRVGGMLERTDAHTWFDAGGFGKGHALRGAVDAALALEPGAELAFDFGGQVVRVTPEPSRTPRWLALAHPSDRSRIALQLRLPRAPVVSVATSGNSERGLRVEGRRIGHLLDPRTGRPAVFDGTVTVIAPDPMVADILSTALFVLGPDEGRALVQGLTGIDAVWQSASGEVVTTLPPDALRLAPAAAGFPASTRRDVGAGIHPDLSTGPAPGPGRLP